MFLIKCKCGSIFTLKKEGIERREKKCPNCGNRIPIDSYTSMKDNEGLSDVVECIRSIPDDAKITVTFDA